MTMAAFDVHYREDGLACAAAVSFHDFGDSAPSATYRRRLPIPAGYLPGAFYRRELPCILKLMEALDLPPELFIIDGYVMLGERPGLGQHLYEAFDGRVPVIGVAKSPYAGATGIAVYRGTSKKPLHVTAAGIAPGAAGRAIRQMHGPYRIPTLLGIVDQLAREEGISAS
jgi:deoxyribonuclease V